MDKKYVWFVTFPAGMRDLECAWTSKNDAIEYFKNEAKNCGWEYHLTQGNEYDSNSIILYDVHCDEQYSVFEVWIDKMYIDRKPYWD